MGSTTFGKEEAEMATRIKEVLILGFVDAWSFGSESELWQVTRFL